MSDISLQLNKPSMLSGHALTFIPLIAMMYGYTESIVYLQLRYLAHTSKQAGKVRISYTKLQHTHFPFYSRRWVMETIARLEAGDFIAVHRTGRVNVFEVKPLPDKEFIDILPIYGCKKKVAYEQQAKSSSLDAVMQVSVALASKVGLLEAIAIQQIHLRHKSLDGSHWVLRSFADWHLNAFMFIGLSTLKRLFARLEKNGLILKEKYLSEYGVINCYRVNYSQIAEVLGIELPESVAPPKAKHSWEKEEKWVSQTNPVKPKQKNGATNDSVSVVH